MVLRYVDILPTLNGWILTGGRINAERALKSLWAPTDFVATSTSPSQISLSWTERANDEQGYRLERRTEGGTYSLIATLAANSNSYLDGGLTDGTKYYYRARAYNDIGDSPAYLTNETSTVTLLNPPTGLSASALSTSEVRLIWHDNSSTEGGYKIERKALEGTFVEIAQVGPNATTFTDSGLSAATRYWYRVRAFSALAGNSAYSEEVSTKTLSSGHHGGGGGCSVGARQNAPTAVADLAIMLIPLVFIALIRRRK
jgi:titin